MKGIIIAMACLFLVPSLNGQEQVNCFEGCWENFKKLTESNDGSNPSTRFMANRLVVKGLEGCLLPDFIAETIDGEILNSADLRGKVLVLNFWFTSCPPCIAELPGLNRLVDEYDGPVLICDQNTHVQIVKRLLQIQVDTFRHTSPAASLRNTFTTLNTVKV